MNLTRIASLIGALATNVVLAGLFLRALLDPSDFTDFIYRTGIMIFMIEFMSLHSSGMLFGTVRNKKDAGNVFTSLKVKAGLITLYSVLIAGFAAATHQWLAAVYFIVSLIGKAAYSRSIDAQRRLEPVAAGIVTLLLSTFVVVFTAPLLAKWFPFSSEVTAARPAGQGGLFIDTPQTLMAWGIIYFSLMTLCEILIFRKSLRRTTTPSAVVQPAS